MLLIYRDFLDIVLPLAGYDTPNFGVMAFAAATFSPISFIEASTFVVYTHRKVPDLGFGYIVQKMSRQ